MIEDTASMAAATASTLSIEVGGSSGSSTVPPVVRGASEAIRLRDGSMVPVALPVPSGAPPCPDQIVAALSRAPPPSLDEEPPLSSSAGTAATAVPKVLGGTARSAPLAGAAAAVPGESGGTARAAPLADVASVARAAPSLASAPAAGSSAGVATFARGADTLADAVARGITPLREELQRVNTTLGGLVEEVPHLRMGHETLARGHERVIMSLTLMRGDFSKAFECMSTSLEDLRTPVSGGNATSEVDDVYTKINEIKRRSRSALVERTCGATVTRDVCLSRTRSWVEYVSITASVLDVDAAAASDWLLGYADLPTRKGASALKSVRRCTPILRVKGHTMHQWKEVITAAYFGSLGLSRDDITPQQAQQLLHSMGYLTSVRGLPATLCGVEAFLLLLGAADRVVQPANAGDLKTINCTLGHVSLVTSLVRFIQEVAAGSRPVRGGVGEGIFDVWVEELPHVHEELPREADEHNGLRLVDGADPCRAQLPEDDGDESGEEEAAADDGSEPAGNV